MYKIEKIKEGYQLTFGGLIKADEMKQWLDESKKTLAGSPKEFGILVDMRTMKPLIKDAQPFMEEGQKLYKKSGMTRSAVILASSVQTIQFRRIAKETGIDKWERYIDSSKNADWEKQGLAWITAGTEPKQ